jgi:REP element-mobilizing transposase RayT
LDSINTYKRRSIRLKEYDYSSPGEYFVTICTHNHGCIFGEIEEEMMRLSPEGEIVKKCWEEISKYSQNVELDEFVIMPNHIHGIIVLTEPVGAIHESPPPLTQQQRRKMILSKIIGRFKMTSAKGINLLRNTSGKSVWQRNYYEHIIRSDKDLNNIMDYIINNPAKWFYDDENPLKGKI